MMDMMQHTTSMIPVGEGMMTMQVTTLSMVPNHDKLVAGLVPPSAECDLFDPQGELFGEADLNSWLREAVDNDPLRDWMEPPLRPEGVADGANSDQDSVPALGTMRRRGRMGGMSRATSMPNVMLAANGLSKSPSPPATMVFPKLEVPISSDSLLPTATSAPLGMPRSLSSGCLLSAANGAPFPIPTTPINAPPAPPLSGNPNSFLSAQAVMAAPSTVPAGVGPPTAVWHAQMGLTPRRKGKGGRQPANDPRLDPTVDPKKARRIVANRISAAKSKLKQKSEIEVLKAQLSEMTAQRDTLQQQTDAMQRHCQGLEDHNKQLQSTVQILQEMQQVQEAMTKKLQAELASLRGDKAPREQDSDHTTGSDSTHHRAELGERRAAMEP